MNKKLVAAFFVLFLACVAFAGTDSSDVSILLGAKVKYIDNKVDIQSASINLSETAYYNKGEKLSAPFFRFDAGAEVFLNESDKPMVGLSGGAYAGYSLGIGPLAKIELAGGVEFFESSVIEYLAKKISKDDSYKITGYVAPAIDLSVFIGLDQVSIKAGIRGSYGVVKDFAYGLNITPYVGVSAKLLQFLNIL